MAATHNKGGSLLSKKSAIFFSRDWRNEHIWRNVTGQERMALMSWFENEGTTSLPRLMIVQAI